MPIRTWIKTLERVTVDNSPLILTAIGVAGTITTALLTGKASFKAAEIILEEQSAIAEEHAFDWPMLSTKDKARLVWKLYIPPVSVAAVTVIAIITANRIGTRRAAALAAAYTIAEKGFEEYREKIIEKMGVNKEQSAREEIIDEKIRKNPPNNSQIVVVDDGGVPFYDVYTGRYFKSSMEAVKKAMNDTNYQINSQGYASLNDLYNQLGLPNIPIGDEIGWRDRLLEIQFGFTATEDEKPAHSISFYVEPVRGYDRSH